MVKFINIYLLLLSYSCGQFALPTMTDQVSRLIDEGRSASQGELGTLTFSRTTGKENENTYEDLGLNEPVIGYGKIAGMSIKAYQMDGQSSNIVLHSNDFTNAVWTNYKSNLITGQQGVDGVTNDATLLQEKTGTVAPRFLQNMAVSFSGDKDCVFSFYAKPSGGAKRYVRADFRNSAGGSLIRVMFDLENDTQSLILFTDTASIFTDGTNEFPNLTYGQVEAGNGFKRCWIKQTLNSSTTSLRIVLGLSADGSSASYTGDGSSGVIFTRVQLEEHEGVSSYKDTTIAPVTTNKDQVTIAVNPTLSPTEGTMALFAWSPYSSAYHGKAWRGGEFEDDTGKLYRFVTQQGGARTVQFYLDGSTYATDPTTDRYEKHKFQAFTWKPSDTTNAYNHYHNGEQAGGTAGTHTMGNIDTLDFHSASSNSYNQYMNFIYWNRRLTDFELNLLDLYTQDYDN